VDWSGVRLRHWKSEFLSIFDPELFEPGSHPLLGDEEIEFDAEEVEELRTDDIRQCTRDLLLIERAREWLLEEGL